MREWLYPCGRKDLARSLLLCPAVVLLGLGSLISVTAAYRTVKAGRTVAMFEHVKHWFHRHAAHRDLSEQLEKLRQRTPVPLFWLFGKTQSGKTSIIKFLTGADDAEIGQGFVPCTRYSREYQFPTAEAPLLSFLDTRGVDEAGYDPSEDLARFNDRAHVVIVTVKALDHAQENLLKHLRALRQCPAQPPRRAGADLPARGLPPATASAALPLL